MRSRGASKEGFYAVRVGRQTGVFRTWGECLAAVNGFSNARYKKFGSHAEAAAFVNSSGHGGGSGHGGASGPGRSTGYHPYGKRSANSSNSSTTRTYPPAGTTVTGRTTVYTDGASQNNGKPNARAGVGVYFGPGDSRNVSEPLCGPRQTNQRAELMAIIRAMEQAPCGPAGETLHILTDSQYSINCLTRWAGTWERNGWRTSQGADVENADLIKTARRMISDRGGAVQFEHVRGHAGIEGNEMADRLAVDGIDRKTQ
ncbi:hypothetical protein GGI15_004213 [Coemansia interrupta]|uniref:Ribonuclease H n=1 Tax=Coemansia interrupta TaxID=1126814 RepID=A0A9W8H5G9_9FUNG|nr:hypothetical protein GGI15_004213 [Coemansia interrupta]